MKSCESCVWRHLFLGNVCVGHFWDENFMSQIRKMSTSIVINGGSIVL